MNKLWSILSQLQRPFVGFQLSYPKFTPANTPAETLDLAGFRCIS